VAFANFCYTIDQRHEEHTRRTGLGLMTSELGSSSPIFFFLFQKRPPWSPQSHPVCVNSQSQEERALWETTRRLRVAKRLPRPSVGFDLLHHFALYLHILFEYRYQVTRPVNTPSAPQICHLYETLVIQVSSPPSLLGGLFRVPDRVYGSD